MNIPAVVTITAGVLFVIGFWSSGVTQSTYGQHHGTYRSPHVEPQPRDTRYLDPLVEATQQRAELEYGPPRISFGHKRPAPFDHSNPHITNVLHAQTIAPPTPHSRNVIPWATPMQWERDAARKLAVEDGDLSCTCDAHIISYWRPIIMRMQATPIEKFEADMQNLTDYINRL